MFLESQSRDPSMLKAILDNAVDGIITINPQGVMRSFNRAAERVFGYPAEDAIGRNVSMLMPEPHQSAHDGYLKNFLTTGQAKIIGLGGRDLPATEG